MMDRENLENHIRDSLLESASLKEKIAAEMAGQIARASLEVEKTLSGGGKVILFGNGGSASDAQHLAAELIGRFELERKPMPAITLVSNPAGITALGNDYGFDHIFERQVEALAERGDVLIGISTSGNSPNVISALKAGRAVGCFRIGLLGRDGGPMKDEVDLPIIVPSERTCRIQEAHITIGHIICEIVEEGLFQKEGQTEDE